MRNLKLLDRAFGVLGPGLASARIAPGEVLRASVGAVLGLVVLAGLLPLLRDAPAMSALVAPFGASAVLLFAIPNSPLAQPWPALTGNSLSALVAIAVSQLPGGALLVVPVSVGLAIAAMALCRAMHPPGGAMAMTVALISVQGSPPGMDFVLFPVAIGTCLLLVAATVWARLTGRRYPMRRFGEMNANRTNDRTPGERLGLDEDDLVGILGRYRQSLNLGAEDLARLIAAAELQAAVNRSPVQTVAGAMSRDLVTVGPGAELGEVAGIFSRHGFTSLPVVGDEGRLLGVIFQLQLVRHLACLSRGDGALRAEDLMEVQLPSVAEDAPLSDVLPHLANHGTYGVPVMSGERIVGIVTQTDLIAALAREGAARSAEPMRDADAGDERMQEDEHRHRHQGTG